MMTAPLTNEKVFTDRLLNRGAVVFKSDCTLIKCDCVLGRRKEFPFLRPINATFYGI